MREGMKKFLQSRWKTPVAVLVLALVILPLVKNSQTGRANLQTGSVVTAVNCALTSCHYIRAGASGNGSGSDWTNAYTSIPSSLTRGDTYFVASGSYGGHNFGDSGTAMITVKKATATDHGTGTGWNDSYGTGQAVFSGTISFNTGYYTFDGAVGGGPGNWTTGHGFKIIVDPSANAIDTPPTISNLDIRHTEITQTGNVVSSSGGAGFYNDAENGNHADNLHFAYNYLHHLSGCAWLMRAGTNTLLEYNFTGDTCGTARYDANLHCETLVSWGYNGLVARYNMFTDNISSGGLVNNGGQASNWEVYGNVFYNNRAKVMANNNGTGWINSKVFNNTFSGGFTNLDIDGSGNLLYNNIYDNADAGQMTTLGGTHDYNILTNFSSVWSCGMDYQAHENGNNNVSPCGPGNSVIPITISPMFVNPTGWDFSLLKPLPSFVKSGATVSSAGFNICTLSGVDCTSHPYDIDMYGNKRSSWTRGAIEYGGTVVPPPANDTTAPSISISSPTTAGAYTSSSANLSLAGTASDNIGVTSVTWTNSLGGSGSAVGTNNWTATVSLKTGNNVITVTASDAAGNTKSATLTVTYSGTPPADTTPPATPSGLNSPAKTTTSVSLAWTANTESDLSGYRVYQNNSLVTTVAKPATTYTVSGLSANTSYNFNLGAIDSSNNESAKSSTLSVTTASDTVPPITSQTSIYIRSGVTGGDGSNWTKALADLPSTLVRGTTYYVADGTYSSHTFPSVTGTDNITIKKATASAHGLASDWVSTYGDGQAVFGPLTFNGSNYILDGANRNENSWSTASAYGFKVVGVANGDKGIRLNSGANYIQVKNTFVTSPGTSKDTSTADASDGVYAISNNHDLLFSHDAFDTFSRAPFVVGPTNTLTLEYSYIARDSSNSTVHAEGFADEGSSNVIIRYNIWEAMNGTAYITELERGSTNATVSNWDIYGNIFRNNSAVGGVGRGSVTVINGQIAKNWKFYNNTIDNVQGYCAGFELQEAGASSSGLENYNNIYLNSVDAEANCVSTPTVKATVGYNYFINTPHDTEPNMQVGTTDPFVNSASGDCSLKTATVAGKTLPAPYNIDMKGSTRGADGLWDRGAIEYGGTVVPPVTDTTAPSVSITAPTSGSSYTTNNSTISLSGTASDNVGVTMVTWKNDRGGSGTAVGTDAWSVSGLSLQSGANVITVTASDAAGNIKTDALTVTYNVLPPADTTAPTVKINVPVLAMNRSFFDRLTSFMAALFFVDAAPTYTTSMATIDLSGTASDNVAVSSVSWSNDLGGSGNAVGTSNWQVNSIGLKVGTNTITVKATDPSGNVGIDAINIVYQPATDTTAPSVPLNLKSSNVTVSSIGLTWDASTDNKAVAGYEVFRDGTKVVSTPNTYFTDSNLKDSTTYTYNVLALDTAGNRSAQSEALSVKTDVPPVVPPSTLSSAVASYNFDETSGNSAKDSTGNGRNGTITKATRVNGKYGQALSFDGSKTYVQITPNNTFDSLKVGTITAWVKPSSASGGFRTFFGADAGQCHYPFELAVNDNKFEVWAGNTGQCNGLFNAYVTIPNPTSWHHLAYVVSDSGNKFFVDGVEVKPTYVRGSATTHFFFNDASSGGTEYNIGRTVEYPKETFNGLIDNVRVYDKPLSASEVTADMNLAN